MKKKLWVKLFPVNLIYRELIQNLFQTIYSPKTTHMDQRILRVFLLPHT